MKPEILFQSKVVVGVIFVYAIAVSSATGQTARERERELNDQELELRSWNLKILSLNANKTSKPRLPPEKVLAQVQEDFTRIQVLNKELVFSISQKRPLDLKLVSKSVSEIGKRSERLNETLALPDVERTEIEPARPVTNETQLKLSLLRLGNLIYSFTNNPFFKQPSVIDTQETVKARRELLEIVDLSAQIKKDTERLKETVP